MENLNNEEQPIVPDGAIGQPAEVLDEDGVILVESNEGISTRLTKNQARKIMPLLVEYEKISGPITDAFTLFKCPFEHRHLTIYYAIAICAGIDSGIKRKSIWERDEFNLTKSDFKFCESLDMNSFNVVFRISMYFCNDSVTRIMSCYLGQKFNCCTLSDLQTYLGTGNEGALSKFYLISGNVSKYGMWCSPQIPKVWSTTTLGKDYVNYPVDHQNLNIHRSICLQTCESLLMIHSMKKYDLPYHFLESNPVGHPLNLSSEYRIQNGITVFNIEEGEIVDDEIVVVD